MYSTNNVCNLNSTLYSVWIKQCIQLQCIQRTMYAIWIQHYIQHELNNVFDCNVFTVCNMNSTLYILIMKHELNNTMYSTTNTRCVQCEFNTVFQVPSIMYSLQQSMSSTMYSRTTNVFDMNSTMYSVCIQQCIQYEFNNEYN